MIALVVLGAIALAACSGAPGAFMSRDSRAGERASTAMLVAAALVVVASVAVALAAPSLAATPPAPWILGTTFAVRIDGLCAIFLVQIFVISALGAIYGLEYWPQAQRRDNGRKLRLFYGIATAGMALIVVAANGVVFLFGWEVMALAAFFLVGTEDDVAPVRQSAFVYLVATRIGTLSLFAFFALLRATNGTFDLRAPGVAAGSPTATVLFVLALIGFGLKAGIMPLHVWLPGAHANAPSHVSALMSGVFIKMGIYGLARYLSFFDRPPMWWGTLLVALGVVSGVLGVVFAIGQHDLKRLLAYHSVENIGIIVLGLGVAVTGRALGRVDVLALGLAGALLHVWNHGMFKALLFFGAGSVLHATGTREIDRLGGLAERMPHTSKAFTTGAAAICGLPPLNGFVSELLVYLGLLRLVSTSSGGAWVIASLSTAALATIGALALACFTKVVGVVFLGAPRSDDARKAHEAGPRMLAPMGVLAAICWTIGLAPVVVSPVLDAAARVWTVDAPSVASLAPFLVLSVVGGALVLLVVLGALLLTRNAPRAATPSGPTWDCGYVASSPRVQYTSSSFARTLVELFSFALRPKEHAPKIVAPFPAPTRFRSHVPEVVLDEAVLPATRLVTRALVWFRWLQHGRVHLYLFYVFATLVLLLMLRR